MRRVSGIGLLIIVIMLLASKGISGFWPMLKSFCTGMWEIIVGLVTIALKFPSEIGITDRVNTKLLYFIITVIAAGLGIGLTARTKQKVYAICGGIVTIISLILTLAAV